MDVIGFSKYKRIKQVEIALNLCVKALIRSVVILDHRHFTFISKNFQGIFSKWRKILWEIVKQGVKSGKYFPHASEKAKRA